MEKRTPYYNRFDRTLLEELKKLATMKKVSVAELLDQAISLILAKYKQSETNKPQNTEGVVARQIIVSVPDTKHLPKRRNDGEGYLRLRNGQWKCRFSLGVDENGKRIQRDFYLGAASKITEAEAQQKFEEIGKQIREQKG